MPKFKESFLTKVKYAMLYLFTIKCYDNLLVEQCNYCNSINIKRITHSYMDKNTYIATFQCLNCNSIGTCQEKWEEGN